MKLDFSLLSKLPCVPSVPEAATPQDAKDSGQSGTGHPMPRVNVPLGPIFPRQVGMGGNADGRDGMGHDSDTCYVPPAAVHKPNAGNDFDGWGHAGQAGHDQNAEEPRVSYPLSDDGASYMPYVVPMSPERVSDMLAEVRSIIGEVADGEGWSDAQRGHVLGMVARQPVASLPDDLAYFRERLSAMAAVARITKIG